MLGVPAWPWHRHERDFFHKGVQAMHCPYMKSKYILKDLPFALLTLLQPLE